MKLFLLMLPLLVALVTQVSAHEIEIAGPQNTSELLRAWTFEPGVIIPIVASAVLYSLGVFRFGELPPGQFANQTLFTSHWAGRRLCWHSSRPCMRGEVCCSPRT